MPDVKRIRKSISALGRRMDKVLDAKAAKEVHADARDLFQAAALLHHDAPGKDTARLRRHAERAFRRAREAVLAHTASRERYPPTSRPALQVRRDAKERRLFEGKVGGPGAKAGSIYREDNTEEHKLLKASHLVQEYLGTHVLPLGQTWKSLGAGQYGSVGLLGGVDPARVKAYTKRLRHAWLSRTVPSSVTVKVQMWNPHKDSWSTFTKRCLHEALVQMRIQGQTVTVGCGPGNAGPGIKASGSSVVPAVFFAGLDAEHGAFVIGMEHLDAVLLDDIVRDRALTADIFVKVERALCVLWLLGAAHGDSHLGNVMVEAPGTPRERVRLLDFGFAVMLPKAEVARMWRAIRATPRGSTNLADAIWYAKGHVQNYVNTVISQRGFSWYNADGKLLRYLYSLLPSEQVARVQALRARVWGCS